MKKVFIASFNRASDGALTKLINKMKEEGMYVDNWEESDYILAVGDRSETFDYALKAYRDNKPIIHLWAGEVSQGTHDEVYRHSITLMSKIQLCTNKESKEVVKNLCKSVGKKYMVSVVGNIMLDNIEIDESQVPSYKYDLVLYNPTTVGTEEDVKKDLLDIRTRLEYNHIWIEPNGDKYSDLVMPYVTHNTLLREQFLGLLKNCNRFITNSSCEYYEAPYLVDGDIIHIGERNINRNSKDADMSIEDASENVMRVLRSL